MLSQGVLGRLLAYLLVVGKGPVVLPLASVCLLPGYLVSAFVLSLILTGNPNMVPGHQTIVTSFGRKSGHRRWG